MVVTPLYAALLVLWFLVLTLRVIHHRRTARVSLGDGGNTALQRAIRAHRISPNTSLSPSSDC